MLLRAGGAVARGPTAFLASGRLRSSSASSWAPSRSPMQQQPQRHASSSSPAAAAAAASPPPPGASVQHMAVTELQELLSNPILCDEVQFIDVREPREFQAARLPRFTLMPLSEASSWAPTVDEDLDPSRETVVLCHHGVRSMQAAAYLVSRGFTNVKNVTGGIAAFSQIDRSVPEY